jgi:hypothetical protein
MARATLPFTDVNTSKAFLRWLWILAILLPTLGQSHAELVTADDLKSALYDVLSHNNLLIQGCPLPSPPSPNHTTQA